MAQAKWWGRRCATVAASRCGTPTTSTISTPAVSGFINRILGVLAVRPDGSAYGVIADTTWRTEIDLNGKIEFTSEGPAFPVIVVRSRISPGGASWFGGAHWKVALAAALGARLPAMPLVVLPGLPGARNR